MNGLRIAMVGTRGVPARHAGFETAIEEIGQRLCACGHKVTVHCRDVSAGDPRQPTYPGMDLVYMPAMLKRALETLSHTGLSVLHLLRHRPDAAIVFNAANARYLPLLKAAGVSVATHVDGLEWKRAKWGKTGKRYYRSVEAMAVRWSDALIADAIGIQNYYRGKIDVETVYLAYGTPILASGAADRLSELGLERQKYHLVVARFEPENHLHLILEGFARSSAEHPLMVVGSAVYSDEYARSVHALADRRVRFIGEVWDQQLLDQLYANAMVLWHGHSVGGTNRSLLHAMGSAAPANAFDVDFNREVLGSTGRYLSSPADIADIVTEAESRLVNLAERGRLGQQIVHRYDWDLVTDGYEQLCQELAAVRSRTPRHRTSHRGVPGAIGVRK